ncbi:hypothetical protein ACWA06_15425 [Serratia rhizosphaerae]
MIFKVKRHIHSSSGAMELCKFWSNTVYDDSKGYIHQDDVVVLDELSKLVDGSIDRTFLPGPFFCPLKRAKIVLFYANPSLDEASIQGVNADGSRIFLLNQLTGINFVPISWKDGDNGFPNALIACLMVILA